VGILNSPLLAKTIEQRAFATQTPAAGTPSASVELTTPPSPTITSSIDTATPSAIIATFTETATPTSAIVEPTQTAIPTTMPQTLQQVFKADFENNFASGFGFTLGNWKIVKDKANHVLQGDSVGSVAPAGLAYFGPSDFTDGVVEFRVKFPYQTSNLYFEFRQDEATGSYALSLDPNSKVVALGTFKLVNKTVQFSEFGPDTKRSFTFQKDTWYKIHLEAKKEKMSVSIDDNRILAASDTHLANGRIRFTLDPNSIIDFDDTNVWTYIP
jgi:hypothetical protein